MKTRRDFLKSLLGAALVVPAVAACRTIAPEPVELPARHDFDAYDPRTRTVADIKFGRMNHGKTYRSTLEQHAIQYRDAEKQVARHRAAFPDHAIFPHGRWRGGNLHAQNIPRRKPVPEWDTARYEK